MANRVPLIVDTSTLFIKELPEGDNLDLTGSGIVGLTGVGGTTGNFSGIVTASSFYVDSNEVISNTRELKNIASLDATTTATIESAIAAAPNDFNTLNISGVSTFAGAADFNGDIDVDGHTELDNVAISGIVTVTGNIDANGNADINGDLNVNGHTDLDNVDIAGVTTFASLVDINNSLDISSQLLVGGATTLANSGGITTTGGDLYAGGDLYFSGDIYQNGALFTSGVGIQSSGTAIGAGVTQLNFVGTGNTFLYNSGTNTVDISISGGGGASEESTSVSTTSATAVASFAHANYRSASILAQITQGSNYQSGRYLLIHDGTTVTVVEESSVATGSMLGAFTGAINGTDVEFRVTMTSASSATVIVKVDKISA